MGGLWGTSKLSLRQAIANVLAARSLRLASFERLSPSRGRVLFLDATDGYWTLEPRLNPPAPSDRDATDDALYDTFVGQLDEWLAQHG